MVRNCPGWRLETDSAEMFLEVHIPAQCCLSRRPAALQARQASFPPCMCQSMFSVWRDLSQVMAEVLGAVTTATKFFFEVTRDSKLDLVMILKFRSIKYQSTTGPSNVSTRSPPPSSSPAPSFPQQNSFSESRYNVIWWETTYPLSDF